MEVAVMTYEEPSSVGDDGSDHIATSCGPLCVPLVNKHVVSVALVLTEALQFLAHFLVYSSP